MKSRARQGIGIVAGVVLALGAGVTGLGQDFGVPGKGLGKPGFGEPAGRPEVAVEGALDRTRVRAGDQLAVAVVLDHARGWHTWPAEVQKALPQEIEAFAENTAIEVGEADWIGRVGPVQWPEPHEVANPLMDPPKVKAYEGRAVAYVPLMVSEEAGAGARTLTVAVYYQACDDKQCLMPETIELELDLEVVAEAGGAADVADEKRAALFEGFDRSVYAAMAAGEEGAASRGGSGGDRGETPGGAGGSTFFGISLGFLEGGVGMVLLLLLSAIGGAILNLTPCVLPVIPIKVMTLTSHAGEPRRALYLGSWMAAGVVAFWLALGVPAILFSSFADPSKIFGIWWVTGGIGVLLAALALGLMGLFSITLPQKAYLINPNAENASGSFLFGVMTGVLGLPCFGFVAGSLLTAAATWGPTTTLGVFGGIGIGMAAPYLVLAAKPSLLSAVPKTGPASELVKQVMGLLLLAWAAYFIGSGVIAFVGVRPAWVVDMPWWWRVGHWWVVALLAVAASGWLILRTVQITKRPMNRVVFSVVGVLIGGTAVAYVADATLKARSDFWIPYTEEGLAAAVEDEKVVVIDFTAEWCLNCKALKAAVLNREPVKGELLEDGVVAMMADLTSVQAPGWEKLRGLGQTGIPLLVIQGPGLESAWMSNAYTTGQVMEALERARGGGMASGGGESEGVAQRE